MGKNLENKENMALAILHQNNHKAENFNVNINIDKAKSKDNDFT